MYIVTLYILCASLNTVLPCTEASHWCIINQEHLANLNQGKTAAFTNATKG